MTKIRMTFEKETPGTIRYKEVDDGAQVVLGTLYVKKDAAKSIDPASTTAPDEIVVTIEAG